MSLDKIRRSLDFISNEAKLLSSIKENNVILKKSHDIEDSLLNSRNELGVLYDVNESLQKTLKNHLVEHTKKEIKLTNEQNKTKQQINELKEVLVSYKSKISSLKNEKSTYEDEILQCKKQIAAEKDMQVSSWTNILGPFAWIVNAIRTGDANNLIPGYNIYKGVESAIQNKVGNLENKLSEIEKRIYDTNLTLKDTENKIIEISAIFENLNYDIILVSEKKIKNGKNNKSIRTRKY